MLTDGVVVLRRWEVSHEVRHVDGMGCCQKCGGFGDAMFQQGMITSILDKRKETRAVVSFGWGSKIILNSTLVRSETSVKCPTDIYSSFQWIQFPQGEGPPSGDSLAPARQRAVDLL